MNIEEYKMGFDNPSKWFIDECDKPYHTMRISNVHNNKDYLKGIHNILAKEDAKYKGKELITRKTIIQYAKTILKFHSTYLLGKPVSLTGDEEVKKVFTDIYNDGSYESVDYQILDRVNKFGDAYEYIYYDNGVIKSKVFDSGDSYPVYDDLGNYIAFIEHWTDSQSNIAYWNVYYPNRVEHWNNEGGDELLRTTDLNVSGLPVHYHNTNDYDNNFGESILVDLKPLCDELEDILSKMGDAVYVNSLSPMPTVTGQRIDSTVPADAMGYVLNLDNGEYKVVSTIMDYQTIKLYLDNIKEMINQVGCMPSVLGNTNVANVSEVSLKMLFHLASIESMESKKWLSIGFKERFKKIKKLLALQGKSIEGNIGVEYNVSIPVATDEVVQNLKAMKEMGAISVETIMEKSGYVHDISVEKLRMADDNVTV